MPVKKWQIASTRRDRSYRIFNLRTDRAVPPRTGRAHDFYVLETPAWVNVIPITPMKEVVLIRQYRHGIRNVTLEIPGGLVEDTDTPEAAARRELIEETGLDTTEMVPLGYVHPNPAIQDNRCYTFLARNAFPVGEQQLDEKEDIEVLRHPLPEIPRFIREGRITHALVLAAFYRYFMKYHPMINGDDTTYTRSKKV